TLVGRANKYMEHQAPWKLAKEESSAAQLDAVLYTALETVRSIAIMIRPFMPVVSEVIWGQLGIAESLADQTWQDAGTWGKLKPGTKTGAPQPIFPRIDTRQKPVESAPTPAPKEEKKVEQISFEEFKRLDLRIGKIVAADRVPGADKLLQITVDIGTEQRPMVAGIAQWYSPEELIGKQILVIANLAPAVIRGVESRGMLLAADVDGTAILLQPDKEVPPGSAVR
ncbi:MAG: methionine--tRNA ligase subunit beta, partial [Armatimonadetes bacterium]|nr:methionine--tRNA ligase subunit beta [Armatimonadota bacterium]